MRAATVCMSFTLLFCVALTECVGPVRAAEGDKKPADAAKSKAPETTKVEADALELVVPKAWKTIEPSNNFRKAVFEIPAVDGESEPAEYVVFYFGGDGGGLQANVKRWIEQFQPKERKIAMTQGMSPAGKYVLVELSGTYNKPIGPPVLRRTEPMSNARMLAVMLAIEGKGNYFLKLAGPEKTVASVAASFRASFGGNAEKEQPFKPSE